MKEVVGGDQLRAFSITSGDARCCMGRTQEVSELVVMVGNLIIPHIAAIPAGS
jgi:hypothetical protein